MPPTPEMIEALLACARERVAYHDRIAATISNMGKPRGDNDAGRTAQLIEDLASALTAALSVASEWRPIESAPRDGTLVLCTDGIIYRVSYYFPEAWRNGEWREPGSDRRWPPTHWQPLLPPPILHKSGCATNNAPAYPPGE